VRVLGIDPGLTRCGVGVVEGAPGRPLTLVGVGVLRTPPDALVQDRLLALADGLQHWLDRYEPDAWRSSGSSASTTCAP
jgi:crossover junction endodeoxyribonuclease RuvC